MIGHFPPLRFLFLFQVRYFRVRSLLTFFVFVFDPVSRIGFVGRDEDSFGVLVSSYSSVFQCANRVIYTRFKQIWILYHEHSSK